jgi:hypothetical protein
MRRDGSAAAPAVEAAAAGRIALIVLVDPAVPFPRGATRRAKASGVPLLLVFVDDLPGGSPGPTAWRCAGFARRWAARAIVHGAVPETAHDEHAVASAEAHGRTWLVETSPAAAPAWADFLGPNPPLLILPGDGGAYPAAEA